MNHKGIDRQTTDFIADILAKWLCAKMPSAKMPARSSPQSEITPNYGVTTFYQCEVQLSETGSKVIWMQGFGKQVSPTSFLIS
jgi:hypothetical protein